MIRALLLGCGAERGVKLARLGRLPDEIVRLDINERFEPDFVCDLNFPMWGNYNHIPGPEAMARRITFRDNSFDEIHAYEILEHLGTQGDAGSFFATFYECWRILKPDGELVASVPLWDSLWAWGDPGHRRVINEGSLVFLDQQEYVKQVGSTPMSDYRDIWKGDFQTVFTEKQHGLLWFVLKARK